MNPAGTRRPVMVVVVLAMLGTVAAVPAMAAAGVTRAELAAAEAAAEAAADDLAAARAGLEEAVAEQARLGATVARLEERRRTEVAGAADRQSALRGRIATLYMDAGGRVAPVVVGDLDTFSARVAYLAAVTDDDLAAVNRFVLSVGEVDDLLASAAVASAALESRIAALSTAEADLSAVLDSARADLAAVQAAWDRQEAARLAAEEAELRRQEAALAAQTATTTTTRPAVTTTTTTPPTYGWDPTRGAEQWRSTVSAVFADWDLDETRCATRNGVEFCVPGQVDNAIRIIACESSGVPFAENPRSGAAGLFQNLPYYWQERVNRIRAYHSDKSDLPANASIWNPEHNAIVAALLVWESREVLLGNRGGGAVSPAVWPEFNWDRYATSGYGYSGWGKGPSPWGHWTCGARIGIYELDWVHPWATQQAAP